MGVGHPYSNPFDMANVLCQDYFILAMVVLALLISIYLIRALAALEFMLGRFLALTCLARPPGAL